MKKITVNDIRMHHPCVDPLEIDGITEDTKMTLIQLINFPVLSVTEKIWIFTRFSNDKRNRLFAVWCTREIFKVSGFVDERSFKACDASERFANNKAKKTELDSYRVDALKAYDQFKDQGNVEEVAAASAYTVTHHLPKVCAWHCSRLMAFIGDEDEIRLKQLNMIKKALERDLNYGYY